MEIAARELLIEMRAFYAITHKEIARCIAVDEHLLQDISSYRDRPTPEITKKILSFYNSKAIKLPFPKDKLEYISSCVNQVAAASGVYATYNFVSALGIDVTAGQKSVEKYCGSYVHLNLNEERTLVTTNCILSSRLGSDRAPVYRSWRVVNSGGYRHCWKFQGAYFTNEKHLFVVGSRAKRADIRLSILHVDFDDDQDVLRGMHLAISSNENILSSRCALMKRDVLSKDERKYLAYEPRAMDDLTMDPSKTLKGILRFLSGHDDTDYIKMAFGG